MRRTKIVATLGPVCDTPELITELIGAGVDIFRFNMKHATRDWHDERIALVRELGKKMNRQIGILIDLQGPEIRLETPNKEAVSFRQGEDVIFRLESQTLRDICIPTPEVFAALKLGNTILIDDGSVDLVVKEVRENFLRAQISQDYTIKHRKSLNLPGIDVDLPSLVPDDYTKLNMENIKSVDFVALSFTRSQTDVKHLRDQLETRNLKTAIIAKIENQMALDHLDEIVESADGIMVARGDLGVETPLEQLAYNQKRIIKTCLSKGKPVITATQMLHSMVSNRRPTRAEACDVSNAVYDLTDATMLSEETAGGAYPVETVKTMDRILTFTETVVKMPETQNGFERFLR